jgi:hypothetical protein
MFTLTDLEAGAGSKFLFHYTHAAAARGMREEGFIASGTRAAYGIGIYATQLPPLDAGTIDDVIANCFFGDALPFEVHHAIVLRPSAGDRAFVECGDGYQWILPTAKLELVYLADFYLGALLWNGSQWEIYDN